ncbi:TonB-dependent receptor plug domain-containing protein [Wenyingzhuangia sp. 1_MG-2023]|nr:TonB-dependent receptor plug domain-containing protein [Wenyingzhuangia sp. 1_MG-2023]
MKTKIITLMSLFCCFAFYSQSNVIVKGKVLDMNDKMPVMTATVSVSDGSDATFVNVDGTFVLEIKKELPVEIKVVAIGYKDYKHVISINKADLTIFLKEDVTSLDEIVISASRTPERVFESPVSIERMGAKAVETTTSATFYDGLENMKGVDVNTSSLTFKSINTRGFATFANTRFVQLVDGMDNSSPGLNFPLGNLIGLNELDVQSVELLPGASSALYGANAFNGIMFMRSKNPFVDEGVSVYAKTGVTSSENAGVNEFFDVGARVAKKFNKHFAAKFTTSMLKATDWFATDTRNIDANGQITTGNRESATDYNGMNIYGDEVSTNLPGIGVVSRTGYTEQDVVNNDTDSFRASLALHFKPFEDEDTEIIVSSKFGTGNTIYQGASRYALRNFIMHQHKLEFQTKHLMLRSYVTIEDAGDSYDVRFVGINLNNVWKDNTTWFTEYGGAYAGFVPGVTPGNDASARAFADRDRLAPGSAGFNQAFNQVISDPDLTKGARFVDSSRLYHSDLNYNFRELIEFAEIQIGGSARRYELNSQGTIFTDTNGDKITYDEYGVYTQLQKKMMEERLKITGSIRYDKAENFEGNFSPRFSVSYSPDENKNHNIRASVQTGFRNPTTQDQYIGLNLGNAVLIGSAPDNLERYQLEVANSATAQALGFGATSNFTGTLAYENSFTLSSLQKFSQTTNPADLVAADVNLVKAEQVTSYEIGYRGKVGEKTVIDLSGYYSNYKDFISIKTVVTPHYGSNTLTDVHPVVMLPNAIIAIGNGDYTAARVYTNSDVDVSSYGVNLGIESKVFENYDVGVNYSYAKQDFDKANNPDFTTTFNTPEHKVKVSFGNNDLYKGFGFGINGRWQDAFRWESSFVDGDISARTILDAQLMYNIEKWKSKVKVGGANILAHDYQSAPGAGTIGSQFYGSWTYLF